jgi:hypothetical protein
LMQIMYSRTHESLTTHTHTHPHVKRPHKVPTHLTTTHLYTHYTYIYIPTYTFPLTLSLILFLSLSLTHTHSYRGEQCMSCKPGWVKMDGQCVHAAAAAIAVIFGFAIMAGYCWYLWKGEWVSGRVRVSVCVCVCVWIIYTRVGGREGCVCMYICVYICGI